MTAYNHRLKPLNELQPTCSDLCIYGALKRHLARLSIERGGPLVAGIILTLRS